MKRPQPDELTRLIEAAVKAGRSKWLRHSAMPGLHPSRISALAAWLTGLGLALSHLLSLSGKQHPPYFWLFTCTLLVSYSLPFVLLLALRIPSTPLHIRAVTMGLFAAICSISLFVPSRRFLPGYHPDAFESLLYLFVPLVECSLIAVYFFFRWTLVVVRPKR